MDPSGPTHTTTFQYDLMGRRTKTVLPTTTPANDTPTTSYDTLGRVWKVTNPNGSYWQNTYDGGGHRTVARDPAGQRDELRLRRVRALVDRRPTPSYEPRDRTT